MKFKKERVENWVKKVQDYATFNKLLMMKIKLNKEIRKISRLKINRKENDLFLLKQLEVLRKGGIDIDVKPRPSKEEFKYRTNRYKKQLEVLRKGGIDIDVKPK